MVRVSTLAVRPTRVAATITIDDAIVFTRILFDGHLYSMNPDATMPPCLTDTEAEWSPDPRPRRVALHDRQSGWEAKKYGSRRAAR